MPTCTENPLHSHFQEILMLSWDRSISKKKKKEDENSQKRNNPTTLTGFLVFTFYILYHE